MRQGNVKGMPKQMIGALAGAVVLLLVAGAAHAITITSATLFEGTVTVEGNKAAKLATISWEGTPVTTSTKGGAFTFTTAVVPPDCVGTLTDGVSIVDVAISGCGVPPPPPTTAFPATGQTSCWDSAGMSIACTGTGQDGDTLAGAPLSYTDNGDGTITDNNTGLMWEKKTNCSTPDTTADPHCYLNTYTWQQALDYVAALNNECFAGHCDWRLSNVKELQSIVNYQQYSPAVSSAFNDCANGSCTSSSYYWSSSSYAYNPNSASFVYFYDGNVYASYKNGNGYVRAVRGGP